MIYLFKLILTLIIQVIR